MGCGFSTGYMVRTIVVENGAASITKTTPPETLRLGVGVLNAHSDPKSHRVYSLMHDHVLDLLTRLKAAWTSRVARWHFQVIVK